MKKWSYWAKGVVSTVSKLDVAKWKSKHLKMKIGSNSASVVILLVIQDRVKTANFSGFIYWSDFHTGLKLASFNLNSDPGTGLNVIKNHIGENEEKCAERSTKSKIKDPCLAFSNWQLKKQW